MLEGKWLPLHASEQASKQSSVRASVQPDTANTASTASRASKASKASTCYNDMYNRFGSSARARVKRRRR